MEKKYLIFFTFIGAVIAAYGIFSGQFLMTACLLVLVVLVALYIHFRSSPQQPAFRNEGWSAIIAAAVITGLFYSMHGEVLLWAVALAALFLIEQSLARIEKRLDKP